VPSGGPEAAEPTLVLLSGDPARLAAGELELARSFAHVAASTHAQRRMISEQDEGLERQATLVVGADAADGAHGEAENAMELLGHGMDDLLRLGHRRETRRRRRWPGSDR
jgi:hypothetical protein